MLQLTPRELFIAEFFYRFAPMFAHKKDPWEATKNFVLNDSALEAALEAALNNLPK